MTPSPHRTPIRVLYGDVDPMKRAYYGQYMRWFEIGRAEFMRDRGLPYAALESEGFFLPVGEAYCKYLKAITYDELIAIETWPDPIRRVSVRFNYRILGEGDDEKAHGYTLHACLDARETIARLPAFLLEVLERPGNAGP